MKRCRNFEQGTAGDAERKRPVTEIVDPSRFAFPRT
jgi:hypothetical protein